MGKRYFNDVSRRLLLFTLLLVGFVTHAQAQIGRVDVTNYVYVFRDMPYTDEGGVLHELQYGVTPDNVKDNIQVFRLIHNEDFLSSKLEFDQYVDEGEKQIKGSSYSSIRHILGELQVGGYAGDLIEPTGNLTGSTDVKIHQSSSRAPKLGGELYFFLHVDKDGNVVTFKEFGKTSLNPFAEGGSTETVGVVNSLVKDIKLPIYTFSIADPNAKVATLKDDIAAKLTAAIGKLINPDDISLTSSTGDVITSTLAQGTYAYTFTVTTPADVKYRFNRADGVDVTPVEPGQSDVSVKVTASIVVTNKKVVTIQVPAKETLSYYEKTKLADAANLGDKIQELINAEILSEYSEYTDDIVISNVQISKSNQTCDGDLSPQNYTYLFTITIHSDDIVVDFIRSNTQENSLTTIKPSRIEGKVSSQQVKVGNSIVIKPVYEASVFSANYDTQSIPVQDEAALKQAIFNGLSNENSLLLNDISFENVRITGSNTYPLGVGYYSYSFDVRAKKDLKIAFIDAVNTTPREIKKDRKFSFTATEKINVQKTVVATTGKVVFPASFKAATYGDDLEFALRNVIELTSQMPAEASNYALTLVAVDGTEYELSQNPIPPAGSYSVKLTLPVSDVYDYSKVDVDNGSRKFGEDAFIATAKLKINQQKIGAIDLPIWLSTSKLGEMGTIRVEWAKNRILSQISAIRGIATVKIYQDNNFGTEVTGSLVPGGLYSYEVILDPNYTDSKQAVTEVGSTIVVFDTKNNSYKVQNAISVKKEEIRVSLPDRVTNPIEIGSEFATVAELTAELTATINSINRRAFTTDGRNLVANVSGINTLPTTNNRTIDYQVTVSDPSDPDYKSKYTFLFTTAGSVSSNNLSPNGNECTFRNSLKFVTTLPTTATTFRLPTYQETYRYGWTAKDVTDIITEDLLLKNAGILLVNKQGQLNYSVALIDLGGAVVSPGTAVSEGSLYGYKVTVSKNRYLQAIELDLANVTVEDKGNTIVITYVNSVELKNRGEANFICKDASVTTSGIDFEYDYVAGITKAQIIEKIKSAILYANPALVGYIGEVTLPNINRDSNITDKNGDFKSAYKVVFTDAVKDFKSITVNGGTNGISTEGTSYVYTGSFSLTARPDLTIKLNKYQFNQNDGSLTEEVIERWIMSDILLNNPDLMGVTISSVRYTAYTHSYTVFYRTSSKVREVKFDPSSIHPIPNLIGGGYAATYLLSITFGDEGDIPGVPYHMSVNLPIYIGNNTLTFGKTAEEYGNDILADIQKLIKADKEALFPQIPTLKNWGGKISLIYNTSGGSVEVIADDAYPQVSEEYGYQLKFSNKADFEKFYKFAYTASGGNLTVDKNEFVYKLSVAIKKATHTVTLPTVNVTYRDINTKPALQDSIKNAILEDPANAKFFADVAKLMKLAKSFTVTLDAPAEGPVPAKIGYGYSVVFADVVNNNIAISTTGGSKLNVNKATLELTFPVTSYRYGRSKVSIEEDLLNKFVDGNNDVFSQYACLADNLSDMFTINLDNVTATPPSVGEYPYTITVQEDQRTAWDNFVFTYNSSTIFNGYAHQQGGGVTIGLRKLTVILPTYLAATSEEGSAAKAAFTFGKVTKKQIIDQITADLLELNPKLIAENIVSVDLVIKSGQINNGNPVIGDYDYTVKLTSKDYTFVYEMGGEEITPDVETQVATAVAAVKVVAPGIVVTFNEKNLKGEWAIVDKKPVYTLTGVDLKENDFGFGLVSISEDPENPTSAMTKERWNQLFKSNKLHWALFKNDKVRFHGNTLNSVLVDSVSNNITQNEFTLRIIDPTTLKAAVGNFDIQLDVALATLKVIPATVEVSAAKATYTKVYGVEVTKASDLSESLAFATYPELEMGYKQLLPEKNVVDMFETVQPVGENVYAADAPVRDYQIQAIDEMVKGMLAPVVGVKFVAGEMKSKVTVKPAKLLARDLTLTVSATREYGEDVTDADVHVAVTGRLSDNFRKEIDELLNAEGVNRTTWLEMLGINKRTDVGIYELRFTTGVNGAIRQITALLENFDISDATIVNAGLTITKAPLTVRAKSYSRPYGAGNPDLEIEYIGLKNNEYQNLKDVFSVMPQIATDATADSRGTYDIYFTVKGEADNYEITYENGSLSIDKIRREIVWPENQRNLVIQVGETVELSAYLKSEADGKPSISDLRYELSGNDRERVVLHEVSRGVYAVTGMVRTEGDNYVTITVSADGDDTYEASTPVTGTIKVIAPEGDAAKVNVIVSNVTSIYDGNPRAVSVKVTDSETGGAVKDFSIYYEGDQFGEIPTTYPSTQDAPTEAGVYSVTVKASLGSVTYQYTAKNKMVIAPKPVVVTARSFNITYGDELPSYTNAYDYNKNDFLNGEDFKVNQAPVVRIEGYNGKAGTYKLTPYSAQDFGRNYVITYASGLLTINKATLRIQADNKESVYGKDLEELTYTATGFVKGETLKNLGFAPRISSTVTGTSDAGTYLITFSDNYTSDNYEVSYIDGKYVILPASQKISWSPQTFIDVEDGDVILSASSSSKLPVVFNSANDAVAYVNQIGDTWILTPVSSGILTVTAMQHGNRNYNAAEPVVVTFLVDGEYLSVGNEKIEVTDNIEVYPRLFTHSVTVTAPSEIKQVELLTMNGVLQQVIRKPGSVIDLSSFGSGIYLLNVTLEDGTFKSVKIIKK